MKVAVVHYWFITRRGGEKVVESILKLYPQADVYTLFYSKKNYGNHLKNHNVYTSRFDVSFVRKHYQKLFPIYPLAIKSLKLKDDYDLIISSESGPAKGINIKNKAFHVCYIHTPMRYCWSHQEIYLNTINPFLRSLARFFLKKLQLWDLKTASNVDLFIANSNNVAGRVQEYYHKQSKVVYPPIAEQLFSEELQENFTKEYFLSFGAITPYKKIDLLVKTFNRNGKRLVVVGEGSEKGKLMKIAKENITFKGNLNELELKDVILKSKALVFPGEEDFGMIPLEVMAHGIPVIAFKKGGALETVVENIEEPEKSSGLFFESQEMNSLQYVLDIFEEIKDRFNANWIRNHAENFRERKFLKAFETIVNNTLS